MPEKPSLIGSSQGTTQFEGGRGQGTSQSEPPPSIRLTNLNPTYQADSDAPQVDLTNHQEADEMEHSLPPSVVA